MAELDHEAIAEGMGARVKGTVSIRHGSIGSEQMVAEIAMWLGRDQGNEGKGRTSVSALVIDKPGRTRRSAPTDDQ